jgi:hypothetical protein
MSSRVIWSLLRLSSIRTIPGNWLKLSIRRDQFEMSSASTRWGHLLELGTIPQD